MKAATVYRQSQGDDDSVSLELQREKVRELVAGADVDEIDLGNHTGFSLHTSPEKDERIDNHPEIRTLLHDLKNGVYDALAAWDDTRLARDQFYWRFEYAATVGNCRLLYVEPPPDDRMVFRLVRAAESETKLKEIKKAQQAIQHRQENGAFQGRPPFGLQYDSEGHALERDPDEWPTVRTVFDFYDTGPTWGYGTVANAIEDDDVTKGKVGRIIRNRDRYDPFL